MYGFQLSFSYISSICLMQVVLSSLSLGMIGSVCLPQFQTSSSVRPEGRYQPLTTVWKQHLSTWKTEAFGKYWSKKWQAVFKLTKYRFFFFVPGQKPGLIVTSPFFMVTLLIAFLDTRSVFFSLVNNQCCNLSNCKFMKKIFLLVFKVH